MSTHSALLAYVMHNVFSFFFCIYYNTQCYLLESNYWWFRNNGQQLGP